MDGANLHEQNECCCPHKKHHRVKSGIYIDIYIYIYAYICRPRFSASAHGVALLQILKMSSSDCFPLQPSRMCKLASYTWPSSSGLKTHRRMEDYFWYSCRLFNLGSIRAQHERGVWNARAGQVAVAEAQPKVMMRTARHDRSRAERATIAT